MDAIDLRIAALAHRQHGCVHRRQLLALGLSGSSIDSRVRTGRLHRRYRGVYAVGHGRLTRLGEFKAAELAGGPLAALGRWSAARHTGLSSRGGANPVEVLVPRAGPKLVAGVRIHRVPGLLERDVEVLDGIRTTTPMRTALDLSAELDAAALLRLLARAEALRAFDARLLLDLLDRHPRRAGRRALIDALGRFDGHGDETRSPLEDDFLELVRRARLPEPVVNRSAGSAIPDFLWPGARLVVEMDSWEHHGGRVAFHADRARNAELVARGWAVMQVTSRQLRHDRAGTADRLARALASRAVG